jgi:hypothetical protein
MTHEEDLAARRKRYADDADHREKQLKHSRDWHAAHPGHNAAYCRRQRLELLNEVIAAYGGACICCGETEPNFLTIDHIFNDGAKHQRSLGLKGKAGIHMYRALKKAGFPRDRYRLMCFNCNCGRQRNGGTCPHQRAA